MRICIRLMFNECALGRMSSSKQQSKPSVRIVKRNLSLGFNTVVVNCAEDTKKRQRMRMVVKDL